MGRPADFHQRHPVTLTEAPTTLDVYPVGGGLDSLTSAKIRVFAERYRARGVGRIAILAPAGIVGRNSRIVQRFAASSRRPACAAPSASPPIPPAIRPARRRCG